MLRCIRAGVLDAASAGGIRSVRGIEGNRGGIHETESADGGVTPPVGLNLFAVSGTAGISLPQVIKGTLPFFIGDLSVLLLVIFYPELATWLPDLLVTDVFK